MLDAEKNAAATEDGAGWGAYSISVLHRSAMQVFYNSKREAEADGYTDYKQAGGHPPRHPTVRFWLTQFDSGSQVNKHGQIHSFGGLRCDAKRLFNDIRKGQDSRVRLFQARFSRARTLPSVGELPRMTRRTGTQSRSQVKPGGGKALATRVYDDADVIVWACGYQSNVFPVCDRDGVEVKLRQSGGQARACAHALTLWLAVLHLSCGGSGRSRRQRPDPSRALCPSEKCASARGRC